LESEERNLNALLNHVVYVVEILVSYPQVSQGFHSCHVNSVHFRIY
jgi:hypothetical protein